MRTYELMFIVKPDVPEDEAERFVTQMEGVVATTGGKIVKADRMGRRRLAYTLQKYQEGRYILFDMECEPATIVELERRLKVADPVIRFITVRTDDEKKRREKLLRERAKRASRKKPKPSSEAAASA